MIKTKDMTKFYLIILYCFFSFQLFSQEFDALKISNSNKLIDESIVIPKIKDDRNPIAIQRILGSGNDICTEAVSLTVGNTFTCGNMATNIVPSSFQNTCVTTSGMGIQNIKVDWYCFNSGTNNTVGIVINNVVNATGFAPAMVVFGPYTTCTGGCAASMSGPLCDNALTLPVQDSIKILENITQNRFYVVAVVTRYDNTPTETFTYCIGVQPTGLDDCESTSSGCPPTCGNLCVFDQAAAPTVTQVTTTCTQTTFSHRMQGTGIEAPADTAEICYNFKVDAGCTLNFGGVTSASGCTAGNLALSDWKIYRKSDCSIPYSGTTLPINPNVSTAGDYIFCFKFVGACDLHFGRYQYAYGTCIVILPVELISFNAIKDQKQVNITWSTATELNNDYFVIERSNDGIEFEPIGIHDSKAVNGNSNQQLDYLFVDNQPLPVVNYYRLKQYDLDGKLSISKIIAVKFDEYKSNKVSLSSTIIDEALTIIIEDLNPNNRIIRIVDVLGKIVEEKKIQTINGMNSYTIPTQHWSSGIYYIQVGNDIKESISLKVLKR